MFNLVFGMFGAIAIFRLDDSWLKGRNALANIKVVVTNYLQLCYVTLKGNVGVDLTTHMLYFAIKLLPIVLMIYCFISPFTFHFSTRFDGSDIITGLLMVWFVIMSRVGQIIKNNWSQTGSQSIQDAIEHSDQRMMGAVMNIRAQQEAVVDDEDKKSYAEGMMKDSKVASTKVSARFETFRKNRNIN